MSSTSLLWSITPPQGQPSWIFGTMHIRDDRAHQLSKNLYPLIHSADSFIGEMDMNPRPFEPGADFYNAHKAWSEKIFRKIRKQFLKSFKFDISNYGHLHPLMIMSVMANSVLESEHHISLDEHLWEYAKQNGKETLGLESFEEQYRILHSIDPMPLYRQILKISKRPASIRKNTAKGLNLYMEGNIHELYILSKSSMKDLRKKIIYKRNEKMASVIIGLNPEVKYFITVGAGHLSGKTGILSALKKEGWKVKPVRLMAGSQE